MVRVPTSTITGSTSVNSRTQKSVAKALTPGITARNTSVNGETTKCMARAFVPALMAGSSSENTRTAKYMRALRPFLMATITSVNLRVR